LSPKHLLLSAALTAAALAGARPAAAYCLTHGCNEATQDCEFDKNGCLVETETSPRLFWRSECISFDVQKDGSARRNITYEAARDAIHEAFRQWLNADCGDGQGPSVRIEDYGPVECRKAEYNQQAGNANIVMFRDDSWPYTNAIDTLALTTLIFNADTGEIYDADIEVNTFESAMAIGGVSTRGIDFSSVITHEIGHFLGLSHSNALGSTMQQSYEPGNTEMATIEADDEAGICAALPPGRAAKSSSCEPRHGFSAECAVEESEGCTVSSASSNGTRAGGLLLVAALSSMLLRKRLRRAGRPRAASPGPHRGPGSGS
jgi:hypothetical protein